MLTEVCAWLRNHFEREVYKEAVVIHDGQLTGFDDRLLDGQYFRITGSVLNEGVHKYPATDLKDEAFTGAITSMAVPEAVVKIAEDIAAWREKYEAVDSPALSPFSSESFGGYSYTKGTRNNADSDGNTWQSVFASRLSPWRKL